MESFGVVLVIYFKLAAYLFFAREKINVLFCFAAVLLICSGGVVE